MRSSLFRIALLGAALAGCTPPADKPQPASAPATKAPTPKAAAQKAAAQKATVPQPTYTSVLKTRPAKNGEVDAGIVALTESDHIALLNKGLAYYTSVPIRDYTCTFSKHERLGSSLKDPQTVKAKFLGDPFSVAMLWTKNPPLADAILYVAGKWPGKNGQSQMLVRPKSGFLRALAGDSLLKAPDGPEAMKNTLNPISRFGFQNSLKSLVDVYETSAKRDELLQKFGGLTDVGGRTCLVLVRYVPENPKLYPCPVSEICLDAKTFLPYRIVGYTKDGELYCDYQYTDVTFNPGLTEADFTPQANDMAPPKKQ